MRLDWNDESFVFGKSFLIRVEGQEMSGSYDFCGGDMQDVETPMTTGEGVKGREAGGFGQNVGEVAGFLDQSSARQVEFKLGSKSGGIAWGDGFPEFREPQCVDHFVMIETGYENRLGVCRTPRDRRRCVDIVSVEGKQKAGVCGNHHLLAAS